MAVSLKKDKHYSCKDESLLNSVVQQDKYTIVWYTFLISNKIWKLDSQEEISLVPVLN